MKSDNNLTMRDLKHRGIKPPHFLATDAGGALIAFVIGLIGCGIELYKGF